MKILGILLIIAVILVGGIWLINQEKPQTLEGGLIYSSEKYGISFEYPKTYFVTERLAPGSALREHFTVMLVEDTEFNRKLMAGEIQGTEGPVSINFEIYQNNLDKQTLPGWVTGTNDSNFKLSKGIFASTTVAEKEALMYTWDGLYRGDSTVFLNGDYVFVATVTSFDSEDQIKKDYGEILKTVKLK